MVVREAPTEMSKTDPTIHQPEVERKGTRTSADAKEVWH